PSNAVYFNNTASYSVAGASTLSAVTAGYSASPVTNTCQFKCGGGFSWNGGSCVINEIRIVPACAGCRTIVLVLANTAHTIGGADSYSTYNAICTNYGYQVPKHNGSSSQGNWYNATTYWSDQYNPTGPWMNGILTDAWPGGVVWMTGGMSGSDTMLSYARYGSRTSGQTFYNSSDVTWYSYHPMTGGNWSTISSGTVSAGQYVLCGK
ncbi:MAG: hypothetical protein PHU93_01230, partial [Candidatus Gracilibacteria bacterium]|nr:hypothetical protein [Candidatus Gracilibacteria bacterium]